MSGSTFGFSTPPFVRKIGGVVIVHCSVVNVRVYNVRTEVSDRAVSWRRGASWHGRPSAALDELTKIRGVSSIDGCGYEVSITIGVAFSWDEVEPEILAVLNSTLAGEMPSTGEDCNG